ncbi:MAG: amidohydrolase family protein [Gammaproteobacteria bacterium]|nr:amidohydrolase family protein [Gammaproteobacteria bacterium]MDH4253527.1 amidohydrolase family protein [Gammaproteobacteria bacterium]MDH5311824.1 amidohydrolase family protein [Gammaproteobacteria bacterium]
MLRQSYLSAICVLLAACGPAEAPTSPAPPEPEPGQGATAFVNATLWDGSGAQPVSGAVIVVRDGRIESAGPGPEPPGAALVDLAGGFVMPGLINTHGHVSGRWAPAGIDDESARVAAELRLLARYGVTTVNSLGGEPAAAFALRDAADAAAPARARLQVAGTVVADTDPAAARATAAANVAQGVDWLKLRIDDNLGSTAKMPWEAVEAVLEVSRESGVPLATHIFYLDDALRLLEAGSGMIAHSVRDLPVTNEFIERLGAAGICYVPTLTRELSTFVYAERPDFFDDPFFLRHADRAEMARISEPAFMAEMAASETAAAYRAAWTQAMENLRELSDAGARIAMGTDSGPAARFPGYFEHLELALMVMAGMTPGQALQSATSVAADCLRRDDIGLLAPGRRADFLVLDANPLEDIAATRSLRAVYIGGRRVD